MKVELKIKMENKKEVVLDEKEAKELFEKLKEIFGTKEKEWVPYYPWRWYSEIPCTTIPYITYTTETTDGAEWISSAKNINIKYSGVR